MLGLVAAQNVQVGRPITEIGFRDGAPHAVFNGHWQGAETFLMATIEVVS